MKHLLFSLFLVFLAAAPAWSKPLVLPSNNPARTQTITIKFPISDTADTEAIPVSGFCSVRFQQASGDDVSLYAVTASTTAATSGTLISAFTASTTTAITFTAGTQWVKAVATDATAGGSVMLIDCAPLMGSGNRNQPTFYVEDYGGKSLTAINNALAACDTWAQANDSHGVVMLPRGKTTIVASTSTSPLISLPEHALQGTGGYGASCDLEGWGSTKDYAGGGTIDPAGSALAVWYPGLMTATNGYKAVIYAPGHNQKIRGFNIVLTGDTGVAAHIDGSTAILAASSTAGSRTFGANGIKHSLIEDVVLSSATVGSGTGFASIFWLDNTLTRSWFQGFLHGYQPITQASTANNANFIAGNRFSGNTNAIYIDGGLACQDMYLHRNTIEANAYGVKMTSTGSCRISSFGTHWEQDNTGSVVGVNDVLIEGVAGSFHSFGDFFDSLLSAGAHVVRSAAQDSTTGWDVIDGGTFRTTTDRPYTYTNGAGIRVNGSAPNIVTTTGTATAKMRGEVHIADHATATSDVDYTLPSAFAGMTGCFYDNGGGDGGVIIDAAAGDEILLYGAGVGVADAIDSPGVAAGGANGDFICLEAIDDTYWITLGGSGTWVDGGVD